MSKKKIGPNHWQMLGPSSSRSSSKRPCGSGLFTMRRVGACVRHPSVRRPLILLLGVPLCIVLIGVEFASRKDVDALATLLTAPLLPASPAWLTESGVPHSAQRTLNACLWTGYHTVRLALRCVAAIVVALLETSTRLRAASAAASSSSSSSSSSLPGAAVAEASDPMVHYASVLTVVIAFFLWAITPLLRMCPCVARLQAMVTARIDAIKAAHNRMLIHIRRSSQVAAAIVPHALFTVVMLLFFTFVPTTARLVSQSWAAIVITVVFPVYYGGTTAIALLSRADADAKHSSADEGGGGGGGGGGSEGKKPTEAAVSDVARSWARNAIASSSSGIFPHTQPQQQPQPRAAEDASFASSSSRGNVMDPDDSSDASLRDTGTPSKHRRVMRRPSSVDRSGGVGEHSAGSSAQTGAQTARVRRTAGDSADSVPHLERDRRARHWLRYFVASSLLLMAVKLSFIGMGVAYVLNRWLPHSDEVELFLIVWLQLPLTNGAQILLRFAMPLIDRHVISLNVGEPRNVSICGLDTVLRYLVLGGVITPRRKSAIYQVIGDSGTVVFLCCATLLCSFVPLLPRWVTEMGVTLVTTSYPAYASIVALQASNEHILEGGGSGSSEHAMPSHLREKDSNGGAAASSSPATSLEAGTHSERSQLSASLAAEARTHWINYFIVWTPVLAVFGWASSAFAWVPGFMHVKLFSSMWLQLSYFGGAQRVVRAWMRVGSGRRKKSWTRGGGGGGGGGAAQSRD